MFFIIIPGPDTERVGEMKLYKCVVCGWVYDEAAGDPEHGIDPGTKWEDVPDWWTCPECGVGKADFDMIEL
jgi:rubredoxin